MWHEAQLNQSRANGRYVGHACPRESHFVSDSNAFVEKGFVKLGNFKNNPRKGQYAYLLTPKGIREKSILIHRFIGRKRTEYENLREEIDALEEEVGIREEAVPSPSAQT